MLPADLQWVGKNVFTKPNELRKPIKLWYYPPSAPDSAKHQGTKPEPSEHFLRKFCLWVPRMQYDFQIKCPICDRDVHSKGLHKTVRKVLDFDQIYYLATEWYMCQSCQKSLLGWDRRVIEQLPSYLKEKFPAVLTLKNACDKKVITFMRSRTLGNSTHALRNIILEMHSEGWIRQNLDYLTRCTKYKKSQQYFYPKATVDFEPVEKDNRDIPTAGWLLSTYSRDVWSRLDLCKAEITSVFGTILKIDSTKKVLKKLVGDAQGTASWVTDIGNEYGAILQCIVTSSESKDGLEKLTVGIVKRYREANEPPPQLLYADSNCCSEEGRLSKYRVLFAEWKDLIIKLDIFHFIMRIELGISSESHPLYGTFMQRLSACIFEWDRHDYRLLLTAKKEELAAKGVPSPSDKTAASNISKKELAKHCRRRTRGVEVTTKKLDELFRDFDGATDTLGVPLFKEGECSMKSCIEQQKKHIPCIQDPDIPLYTQIGTIKKGKQQLPVYRCARGSSSLESFHSALPTFIPGKRANAVNFQSYLVDGIARWNRARKDAATQDENLKKLRTFDSELLAKFNELHLNVHGEPFNNMPPPNKVTDEFIGMEYLYQELNKTFEEDEINKKVDEIEEPGEDDEGIEVDFFPAENLRNFETVVNLAEERQETTESELGNRNVEQQERGEGEMEIGEGNVEQEENRAEDEIEKGEENATTDTLSIPGWDKVDALAKAILAFKDEDIQCLSDQQATRLLELYEDLIDFDKKPLTFTASPKKTSFSPSRYRARKPAESHTFHSSMTRVFYSGSEAPISPEKIRLVEAICFRLAANLHESNTIKVDGVSKRVSKQRALLYHYNKVKDPINKTTLLKNKIVLGTLNETTIRLWLNKNQRMESVKLLMTGRPERSNVAIAATPLPGVRPKPTNLEGHGQPMVFPEPMDRSGQALRKHRKSRSAATFANTPPLNTPPTLMQQPMTMPQLIRQPMAMPQPMLLPSPPTSPLSPMMIPLHPVPAQHVISTPSLIPRSTFHKRKQKEKMGLPIIRIAPQKCKACGEPMNTHQKYLGRHVYCKRKTDKSYEDFCKDIANEIAAKKAKH